METIKKNTVFTNVAQTSDGGVFWEGLEDEMDLSQVSVTSWLGEENWTKESGKPSSHPNSRLASKRIVSVINADRVMC
jgi:phosphoenolpyruvate carboxykinase (GTP)